MSTIYGDIGMKGNLGMKVIRAKDRVQKAPLMWRIKNAWRAFKDLEFLVPIGKFLAGFVPGLTVMTARLHMKVFKADGTIVDYGMVGTHLVTTAGKTFIVDSWRGSATIGNMKYHGLGTGATAAAVGDTALQTELTTQYAVSNTRPTGTLTNNGATVLETVGVNTVSAGAAVTEWGLLSQAANSGGTLFDRQVFSVVNLSSGDTLQSTYDLTVS